MAGGRSPSHRRQPRCQRDGRRGLGAPFSDLLRGWGGPFPDQPLHARQHTMLHHMAAVRGTGQLADSPLAYPSQARWSQSLRAQPPSSPIPEKLGPHAYPSRKAFAPVRIGIRHKVSDRLDSESHKGLARLVYIYIYIYIYICIYIYIYPSLCLSEPLKDGCGTRFMHVWMRGCIERIDG